MNIDNFINKWLGQKVDFDHVFQYKNVDLILQYLYEVYNITDVYGNPLEYWTHTSSSLFPKFFKIQDNDLHRGDIVILSGPTSNIGIATGNQRALQGEILEQGGSGDPEDNVVQLTYIDKSTVVGILRPGQGITTKEVLPIPEPYTVEPIDPKEIVITRPTHKFAMNHTTFSQMIADPIREVQEGEHIIAVALCIHTMGESFYMDSLEADTGYNVKDCADHVPVARQIVTTPLPPVIIPTSTERYRIKVALPGYRTAPGALNRTGSTMTVEPGDYFIFNRLYDMIAVTKTQGYSLAWINPNDNVKKPFKAPEPLPVAIAVPEPDMSFTATYRPLNDQQEPIKYVSPKSIEVRDYSGTHPDLPLPAYDFEKRKGMVDIYGIFEYEGKSIYRLRVNYDKDFSLWYGVPIIDKDGVPNLIQEADTWDSETDIDERRYLNVLKPADYVFLALAKISKFLGIITNRTDKTKTNSKEK